jgi:predicted MPP superfamily phosphohydrolase
MKVQLALRIFLFLLLFSLLNWFIGWNGWVFIRTSFNIDNSTTYWIAFGLLSFGYILAMMLRRVLPYFVFRILKILGSYWIAVFQYAIIILPLADLLAWILWLNGVNAQRSIVGIGCVVLLIIIILLLIGSRNAWSPVVQRYSLHVDKPAGMIKQLSVAVASDLHLGTIVGKRHLERLVEQMDMLRPDLILLPGDVLDDSLEPFVRNDMADTMKKLKAPLGVFAVLGNHEYFGGHIEEYIKRLEDIGIRVLRDETVLVADSFYLVGRKDKAAESFTSEGRLPLTKLVSSLNRTLPILVMDHQPHHRLDEAAASGIDLLMSGHTHRGQMAPNHMITRRIFELDWGYARKGTMHAIVSSGFGTWGPPIRIGSRSEIVEITITFGN